MDAYQRHSLHPHLDLRQLERLSVSKPSEESKDEIPVEVVFNPLDVYLHGLVRNLVDYVCLNQARQNEIKRLHNSEDLGTARSIDNAQS